MAKKRANKRAVRDDDSDDDTLSTTSTTSYELQESGGVDEEHDEETMLDGYIDALYEKRATTREAGLKGLIAAMTSQVITEFVENKHETLSQQFIGSLKRGSAGEVALAARALGLLAVTLGAGDESDQILEESSLVLRKVAKSTAAPAARIAALETLALLSFVCSAEAEAAQETMDLFWQIGLHSGTANHTQKSGSAKAPANVRAAAIAGWTLVLSTDPDEMGAGPEEMTELAGLLRSEDTAVRTAAGEAIALLHESGAAQLASSEGEDHFSDEGSSATSGGAPEEVLDVVRDVSQQQAGKRRSKKDKQWEKASFRDILASIEEGSGMQTAIKLQHGDTLTVTSWSQTVQLNAMRKFLAEGFQRHLQDNTLLHEIFNYEPRTTKVMGYRSKTEKRLYKSPNSVVSKARTQARTYSRSVTQAEHRGQFDVTRGDDDED